MFVQEKSGDSSPKVCRLVTRIANMPIGRIVKNRIVAWKNAENKLVDMYDLKSRSISGVLIANIDTEHWASAACIMPALACRLRDRKVWSLPQATYVIG